MVDIVTFLYSNWQSIIVALGIGFLFFILSTYGIKKYVSSAERERLKQAKNSMLDILESRIINKQNISIDKINSLLTAIDRENSVDLTGRVSPSSLLEDLGLRFEKSHHLDPSQKEEYCKKIEEYIGNIIKEEEKIITVPTKYTEIVDILTENIKSNNSEKALESLELLKKKIKEREEYPYSIYSTFRRLYERSPLTFYTAVLIAILFYCLLIWIVLTF